MREFQHFLIIAASLLCLSGCGTGTSEAELPLAEFDQQAWLDGKDDDSRQLMIQPLENELERGMTSDEILHLLGEPDRKINHDDERSFIYGLGRGMADYLEYRIDFDADWTVHSYRKVQG